jgi:hypothetical protein
LAKEVDGTLFENSSADALFYVLAAAVFEDYGFDSL